MCDVIVVILKIHIQFQQYKRNVLTVLQADNNDARLEKYDKPGEHVSHYAKHNPINNPESK